MDVAALYGWLATATALISMRGRAAYQWAALTLWLAWLVSNVLYSKMHPPGLLIRDLIVNGACFVLTISAFRTLRHPIPVTWAVLVLWCATWLTIGPERYFWYYFGANRAFELMLISVCIASLRSRV